MDKEQIIDILKTHRQEDILKHLYSLASDKQEEFMKGMQELDLNLIFNLYKKYTDRNRPPATRFTIQPARVIPLPRFPEDEVTRKEACIIGESFIKKNKLAVMIAAGGQGSRLGFNGPKGAFPISPVKNKSLFQLFCESIKAISIRYNALVPLLIMTSHENYGDTKLFFESNNFFGLDKNNIHFFRQGMLPSISPLGKLILKDEIHLFTNPDGHGGSLKALYDSGLLESLTQRGFSDLFYCQVDNPLVRIADPVFVGYHKMLKAEMSTKIVHRRNCEEKVGVFMIVNGKTEIIEYSDLGTDNYCVLDEKGRMRDWAGNIAVHIISLKFIQRLNKHGFTLPYHRAEKTIEAIDADNKPAKITGWKFETFIFDAVPLAKKTCCVETIREEEFAPVKNKEGEDSPETVKASIIAVYKNWLREAGIEAAPEAKIEISPLFALDKEELINKLKGRHMSINKDTYIE